MHFKRATAVIVVALGLLVPCTSIADDAPRVNTLDSSAEEIESFFATLTAVRNPDSVDALPVVWIGSGKTANYSVDDQAVQLNRTNAQTVSKLLLNIDSYLRAMSACTFEPIVAFRFISQDSVVIAFVDLKCSEVRFEDPSGRNLGGRFKLGAGREPLLAIVKAVWPENPKLQALPE